MKWRVRGRKKTQNKNSAKKGNGGKDKRRNETTATKKNKQTNKSQTKFGQLLERGGRGAVRCGGRLRDLGRRYDSTIAKKNEKKEETR